jgi:hypothetical protein
LGEYRPIEEIAFLLVFASAVPGVAGIFLGIVSLILVQVKRRSLKGRWYSLPAVFIYTPFLWVLVPLGLMLGTSHGMAAEVATKQQRLLHQTDHYELREACREAVIRYNKGMYSDWAVYPNDQEYDEDCEQVPEIILGFEPVYIWFSEEWAMVALIGGMDPKGVRGCLEGQEGKPWEDEIELIDGLYYYDDGLREAGDYRDYLESLKEEALTYREWVRKQKAAEGKALIRREALVEAATKSVKSGGFYIEGMTVTMDEGNAQWKALLEDYLDDAESKEFLRRKTKGHDYQVIHFAPPPLYMGGAVWVLVDRETGKVLTAHIEQ